MGKNIFEFGHFLRSDIPGDLKNISIHYPLSNNFKETINQPTFICSKTTTEAPEQRVKFARS